MWSALLSHPRWVIVGAWVLSLAGLYALTRMPLQLLPDVEEPSISIWTSWPGAAAAEVERALTEPQESAMRGLEGLREITASASPGGSWIELRFAAGADLDRLFVDVIGRLQRVPAAPREAAAPVVSRGGEGPQRTLLYLFVQRLPGAVGAIESHQRLIEREVVGRLEAIPGVASARLNAGPDSELRIEVDPFRAAALGIELPQLVATLSRLDDVSAGSVELGRTAYALRMHGRLDPADLEALAIGRVGERVIRLSEIASARWVRPDRSAFGYQNGNPALSIQLFREPGSNVLATLDAIEVELMALRRDVLAPRGLDIRKSFEPGIFIRRALGFLSGNLGLGVLAVLALLWLFLRDVRLTLLIAIAVPVSLAATLLVLALLGRSLNMISIAGLAFAVGMVMDAAIVVVESIDARRRQGLPQREAVLDGTRRVWTALLAATLTTVAVFVPVLALRDVEGQVFADLALTVAIAVLVSLAVALWLVPVLMLRLLAGRSEHRQSTTGSGVWPRLAQRLAQSSATPGRALVLSLVLTLLPLLLAWWWAPPRDYLPPVKRAAVDAYLQTPPGMGAEAIDVEIAQPIIERLAPYMRGEQEPALLNYYILAWSNGATLGVRPKDPARIGEVEALLNESVLQSIPDFRAYAAEGELFGGAGGSPRAIWINLRGPDLDALRTLGERAEARLRALLPDAQVQLMPGADSDSAELSVRPRDQRLAELGLDRAWLADALRVLGDGRFLGEHFDGERRLAMVLRAPEWTDLEQLAALPLATPRGSYSLGELAQLSMTRAPRELRRVDFGRAVTITVEPPAALSLEEALARIESELLPELRGAAPDVAISLAGSAGRLEQLSRALAGNGLLALGTLLLVLLLTLRSGYDSAVVMATLPLAALGGVVGLRVLGLYTPQPLDLLTMIGFVMLLAMVISNGVLLVAETRHAEAAGRSLDEAIELALRERLRPITLGALTGVVGALPLAVSPGPAAAIYRGLAAVTCGGVLLSLLLTVVLVPALLRLPQAMRSLRLRRHPHPSMADASLVDAH
mgnify:CR=1 FL=1